MRDEEANYVNNSHVGGSRPIYQGSNQGPWRENVQGHGNQGWRNEKGTPNLKDNSSENLRDGNQGNWRERNY